MGTQLIIELDILRHAFAVALLRGVLSAVRLLFFEGSKKRFGDRVVMGPCCSGKGLFRAAFLQQFRSISCICLIVEVPFVILTKHKIVIEGRQIHQWAYFLTT